MNEEGSWAKVQLLRRQFELVWSPGLTLSQWQANSSDSDWTFDYRAPIWEARVTWSYHCADLYCICQKMSENWRLSFIIAFSQHSQRHCWSPKCTMSAFSCERAAASPEFLLILFLRRCHRSFRPAKQHFLNLLGKTSGALKTFRMSAAAKNFRWEGCH